MFLKFGAKDIATIEIQGNKMISLAKILGWSNGRGMNVLNVSGFRMFIGWLFGVEYSELSIKDIETYFFGFQDKAKETSYEVLL